MPIPMLLHRFYYLYLVIFTVAFSLVQLYSIDAYDSQAIYILEGTKAYAYILFGLILVFWGDFCG